MQAYWGGFLENPRYYNRRSYIISIITLFSIVYNSIILYNRSAQIGYSNPFRLDYTLNLHRRFIFLFLPQSLILTKYI